MRDTIRFVLDDELVELMNVDPTRTVLQYLREDRQRLGTKEGCAEGDCGACTVVVGELDGDQIRYRAINSCIQFLPTLDGKALFTVESLSSKSGDLHPVQRAMVECDGSQCGFCTPGFVMSMFAMYQTQASPTRTEVDIALAGNLCRCTGYRPIADAASRMYEYERTELDNADTVTLLCSLLPTEPLRVASGEREFFAPVDLEEFAAIAEQYPDACILAGGTDIGLWVTKQYRDLQTIIYTANVAEMKSINVTSTHIDFGAAVTLSEVMPVLSQHYPELDELFLRFASPPIRNAATLGGNIANGSPIGDSMPALIALGSSIVLRKGNATREMALDDFYLDYQKTALHPGEFVERVRIPLPAAGQVVRSYKLSKRFDQDISAVCGAYLLELEDGTVKAARIAYGGVAAVPKRAVSCEAQLIGKRWNEDTVRAAMAALDDDFVPLSDMRSSAQYRQATSRNLLYRFYLESSGHEGQTNVYSYGR